MEAPATLGEEAFVILGNPSVRGEDADGSSNEEVRYRCESGEVPMLNSMDESSTLNSIETVTDCMFNNSLFSYMSDDENEKKIEEIMKQTKKLKEAVTTYNLILKTWYNRILYWKEAKNEKIKTYKNIIDELTKANNALETDVDKYKKIKELQDEEIISLKNKMKNIPNLNTALEIESLQKALDKVKSEKDKLKAENDRLTQNLVSSPNVDEQLQAKDHEIKNLQIECKGNQDEIMRLRNKVDYLKQALSSEKQKINDNKPMSSEKEINELKQENCSLRDKIATLEILLNSKEDLEEKLNQTLKENQNAILVLEEERDTKIKQIEELRKLVQDTSKDDEIYALHEQMNQYKYDFEVERSIRNDIEQCKGQIEEDMKNLQRRNQQLLKEIEALREQKKTSLKTDIFKCPKCFVKFGEYSALESHLPECIELVTFP